MRKPQLPKLTFLFVLCISAMALEQISVAQCFDDESILIPPDEDNFAYGQTLAMSGDWLVVGLPANSVTMGQTAFPCTGGVQFLRRTADGVFEVMQTLDSPINLSLAYTGASVSIDGNVAVVGINTVKNPADNNSSNVFVYEKNMEDEWIHTATLNEPGFPSDSFYKYGFPVAIHGDSIAVGNGVIFGGGSKVHFYRKNNGRWEPDGEICGNDIGYSIDLDGDRMLCGGWGGDSALVYRRMGDSDWQQEGSLMNSGLHTSVVNQVALSDDTAVVTDQGRGRVDIFEFTNSSGWSLIENFVADEDADSFGGFFQTGRGIDIDGDDLVIGNAFETISGDQRGAVYVYRRQSDGVWNEVEKKFGEPSTTSEFGISVAVEDGNLAVGYYDIGPGAQGGNGNATCFNAGPVPGIHIYSSTNCDAELLGDVNCDGEVNLLDVAPFVELLSNGGFSEKADINQDGSLDLLDVSPFVALLSGG